MGRALVIAALVAAWPVVARADESTELHVESTDITVYADGDWVKVQDDGTWESWVKQVFDVRKQGALSFSSAVAGGCPSDGLEGFDLEGGTQVYDLGTTGDWTSDSQVFATCTQVGDSMYFVRIELPWGADLHDDWYYPIVGTAWSYVYKLVASNAPAPIDEPYVDTGSDEPPEVTYLRVEAAGLSFDAPGQWTAAGADTWSYLLIPEVVVAFEEASVGGACPERGMELSHDYFEENFTPDVTRIEDRGTGEGLKQVGACIVAGERSYAVVVTMPEGMNPQEVPQIGMLVHRYAVALLYGETPHAETSTRRGFLGRGIWPNAIVGGIVRRADSEASAWGGGLEVTRRPWHPVRHVAIGYELSLTAASGWVSGAASVHPGLWLGSMHVDRDTGEGRGILVDAYAALGVDTTTGSAAPATGTAVTFGAGVDGMLQVYGTTGIGLDASVEVLADPSGFHSHTEGLAIVFGRSTYRLKRVGVRHVGDPATGSVWWLTFGFLNASNDR